MDTKTENEVVVVEALVAENLTQEPEVAGTAVLEAKVEDAATGVPPKSKSPRGKKAAKPDAPKPPSKGTTLDDLAAAYIAAIESDGASTSTVTGYRSELARATKVLGAETLLADLSADAVKRYFRSKHVTMKRDGEKRNLRTVDRSRRVLRLALCWAEERGIIESAPIPENV